MGDEELKARARSIGWYHSIELRPGFVTKGEFDLRPYVEKHCLPERLDGMRALDAGTFNGFWAFEMERRGAEVIALDLDDPNDLDWPAFRPRVHGTDPIGDGFRLAREALGSEVERVPKSLYAATPDELGTFDFAFCGAVLIHLRDPLLAMERIHGLLNDGGTFLSAEAYSRIAGLSPFPIARYRAHRSKAPVFWEPSARTWKMMLEASGFTDMKRLNRFRMDARTGYHIDMVVHEVRRRGPKPREAARPTD